MNKQKATRVRYSILAAVFVNVVINYMDRSNISVAAAFIKDELELTPKLMGYIFSAFGLSYALLQIPGGILADRYKTRTLYSICLIAWSVATILQGLAVGFALLLIMRIFIGAFEAPSYPINNKIVTNWFPDNERAGAIATYTSGQFIGLAFLTPALFAIEHYAGWRALFYITGSVGLVWGVFWFFFYRTPFNHKRVNQAELDHIKEGGGLINKSKESEIEGEKFKWKNLGFVLSKRKLWGVYLGQFCLGSTLIFFLTWFPTYLVESKGMTFLKKDFSESLSLDAVLMASIPFIFAFAGVLLSGFLSDFMAKRGINQAVARKTPVIIGLLLSTSIIGANYVSEPFWVTFFLSLTFFGNGLASIAWVFVSLLSPKKLVGLTGGTFNLIGGLSAVITPTVIGFIVDKGGFSPALVYIGALALLGALSYIFLVGKIERIKIK